GPRVPALREAGSALHPAGRGGSARRRSLQGQAGAGVGADGALPRTRADDGGCRPGAPSRGAHRPLTMRALVPGAGGFVGQYLGRARLREGWSVAASTVGRLPEPGTLSGPERSAIHWRNLDLRVGADERRSIRSLLEAQPPDVIFHLA